MTDTPASPIRETDDEARSLARGLITGARFAALGVLDPETRTPLVTRIAVAPISGEPPLTLISSLSRHTEGLLRAPDCSLLVGEPGPKGDPLTHPRMTLQCRAAFVDRGDPDHARLRARYLDRQPKARLYIDFADFSLVRMHVTEAHLNGGFGRAYRLSPADLGL